MSSPTLAQHFVTPTYHPRGGAGRREGERQANSHPTTGVGREWGKSPRALTSTDQGRSCSSSRGALTPAPQSCG
eukprot:3782056-Pleurochrysis_carterae.AAC.1